jgi:hypothetical protein
MKFIFVNGADSIGLYVICSQQADRNQSGLIRVNLFLSLMELEENDQSWQDFFPPASHAIIDVADANAISVNIISPDGIDLDYEEGTIVEAGEEMPVFRIKRIIFQSSGN